VSIWEKDTCHQLLVSSCPPKAYSSHSALKRDTEGILRMDYEDMTRKIEGNKIHLVVFCNLHNPCGRVWTREELERADEVCAAHDCVVISDEI